MKRVLIIGPSGSGKSTLARKLSKKLQLPLYHMDKLFWKPGWIESSDAELFANIEFITKNQVSWIIDGNYASSLELRLQSADTVIYLDFPRYIYFPRIFKRVISNYGKTRPDMAEDCPESLDLDFVSFVWNFKKISKPRVDAIVNQYKHEINVIHLYNPNDVKKFLDTL